MLNKEIIKACVAMNITVMGMVWVFPKNVPRRLKTSESKLPM